jgi:phage gp36-like protein
MSYSTVIEVRQLLIGVSNSPATDYDLTPNQLTDAQISGDIANADAQIDAALGDRYTVPFPTPIPSLINMLSVDIAAYLGDLRFRGNKEFASELNPFYLRYQRATQMLTALESGTSSVPGVTPPGVSVGDGGVFNPYDGHLMRTQHIFTRWPEGVINDG